MYAVQVKLQGKGVDLAGEFYEDGNGGLIGEIIVDGVRYEMGVRGKAIGLFDRVTQLEDLKSGVW